MIGDLEPEGHPGPVEPRRERTGECGAGACDVPVHADAAGGRRAVGDRIADRGVEARRASGQLLGGRTLTAAPGASVPPSRSGPDGAGARARACSSPPPRDPRGAGPSSPDSQLPLPQLAADGRTRERVRGRCGLFFSPARRHRAPVAVEDAIELLAQARRRGGRGGPVHPVRAGGNRRLGRPQPDISRRPRIVDRVERTGP